MTHKHWCGKAGFVASSLGTFSLDAILSITCSRSVSVECNLLCKLGCIVHAVGTAGAHSLLGSKSQVTLGKEACERCQKKVCDGWGVA